MIEEIKEAIEQIKREGHRVHFPSFFSDFVSERDAENARACVVEVLEQLTRRPLSKKVEGCDCVICEDMDGRTWNEMPGVGNE